MLKWKRLWIKKTVHTGMSVGQKRKRKKSFSV